jgi:hypothetical protein
MWVNRYFTFACLSFYNDADLAEQRKEWCRQNLALEQFLQLEHGIPISS